MDPVRDFAARLHFAIATGTAITERELSAVERDVRAAWGGDFRYVSRGRQERMQAIASDWAHGLEMSTIAARYGVTTRWVRKVVKKGTEWG
jgi:Mor family transcriptional regulator